LNLPPVTGLGTILNAGAIVLGGTLGLTVARQISTRAQSRIKVVLAVITLLLGIRMMWEGLNGTFGQVLKQLGIVLLALILGNVTGRLLRIQRSLNWLGRSAKERFASARTGPAPPASEGFVTCSLLFCVGPMAILGSVQDGLLGDFRTLGIKSLMDGLATMAFVSTFGWSVMLAVIPVVAYQGTLTLLAKSLEPVLQNHALLDSINVMGGLLVFCIPLIILDLKKVPLADYLPSLAIAPLLTWWWR
jgi:hypothetical protein